MWRSDVTQEPYSVICLWINNSETAKVIWPPSPTKAQRPKFRCAPERTRGRHRYPNSRCSPPTPAAGHFGDGAAEAVSSAGSA